MFFFSLILFTFLFFYVIFDFLFITFRVGVEFLHVKPGKGAAFVRTKMRNYVTGNTVDKTFRAGSTVIHLSLCFFSRSLTLLVFGSCNWCLIKCL